jgi:hypothetical protein
MIPARKLPCLHIKYLFCGFEVHGALLPGLYRPVSSGEEVVLSGLINRVIVTM